MAKDRLLYYHGRNLFSGSDFKPFVSKYFKDVKFLGFDSGNYLPEIEISNWNEVKDSLPKSYLPIAVNDVKLN